jgi:two-component system cell cycle response regulator DivK
MISELPVVLLVDDHDDPLEMHAFGLLAMGFQPLTAVSVDEGYARACASRPHIVVADLDMMVRSGFTLFHQLRRDARTRNVPIVALTGLTLASTRQQAREAGCQKFVLKPCMPDVLAAEIREVLGESAGVYLGTAGNDAGRFLR